MNKYSPYKIFSHREKLESLKNDNLTSPLYVRIKPVNYCDHDCFFCVYAAGSRRKKLSEDVADHISSGMHEDISLSDVIPRDRFPEIIEELSSAGVKAVTFSGGGEPLLHPTIDQAFQKCIDNNIDFSIITNGQNLVGKRAELLAKSSWVRISMDYTNKETMASTRNVPEKMFDQLISNIQNFARLKSTSTDLGVNYIVHKQNCDDLVSFSKILKDAGVDNVRFSPMWLPDYQNYHADIQSKVQAQLDDIRSLVDSQFSVNSTYDISLSAHSTVRPYPKCFIAQIVPVIGADLNIYACHNKAYDKTGIVASMKDRSFSDAWFSEEARSFHRSLCPPEHCQHQCSNDNKNIIINEFLDGSDDSFI